jgi:hypothetical protein
MTRLIVLGALLVAAVEAAHWIARRVRNAGQVKPAVHPPEGRRDDNQGWRRFDPATGQVGEPSGPRTRAPWLHRHKRNRWRIGPLG